jgi:hypothetical protein
MRAAILHGDDAARRRAPEDHRLVEKGAREYPALDFLGEGRDILAHLIHDGFVLRLASVA